MFLIGLDNQPHQMVPHYVAFIEVAERQTWNGAQYGSSLYETRTPAGGKINLGDVARNHCLGVHADARQELNERVEYVAGEPVGPDIARTHVL